MSYPPLTKAERAEFERRYRAMDTVEDIGAALGMNRYRVQRLAKALNLPPRTPGARAKMGSRRSKPVVPVPAWVPDDLRRGYVQWARDLDEHEAAAWAREMKRSGHEHQI